MKKFAIFLPQFHEIPENDLWWGKGFTEWTNVRRGTPLFKNHLQPKEPLNDNYYNLLDRETVEWQTSLLDGYHIDGLAYYHYYFNGKMLLEKPAENLLKWKDINQKFFFIWANHSWIKSWEGKRDLLMEQTYGTEPDWEAHFQYLLPFFKDDRYEKKDNAPVFGVFNSAIPDKDLMFEYLDRRCKEEGFSGIYLFESYGTNSVKTFPENFNMFINETSKQTSAIAIRQPVFCEYEAFKGLRKFLYVYYRKWIGKFRRDGRKPLILNGNKLVDRALKLEIPDCGKDIISGVFFEWDNTSRHKSRGYVITPLDKEHVFKMMDNANSSEYVLLNAWNEWAEGMALEPTKENGYKYLEWIKEWSESQSM